MAVSSYLRLRLDLAIKNAQMVINKDTESHQVVKLNPNLCHYSSCWFTSSMSRCVIRQFSNRKVEVLEWLHLKSACLNMKSS